jgi:hypothetical protein
MKPFGHRDGLLAQVPQRHAEAEREVLLGEPADALLDRELAQAIDGEDAVDVQIGAAVVVVRVIEGELGAARLAGDHPVAVIALDLERPVLLLADAGGGDEADHCLLQPPLEGGERDAIAGELERLRRAAFCRHR